MSEPLSNWLREKGYEPYVEVPAYFGASKFDLVGLNGEEVIIIEMKTSLTAGAFRQCLRCQLASREVYCAVATNPREQSIEKCEKYGLGVLKVQGEAVIELLSPGVRDPGSGDRELRWWELRSNLKCKARLLERLEHMEPGGVAGLPNRKGIGPAQDVERLIIEYKKEHPKATWKEMYENIPNHYASYKSMSGAMKRIVERRLWKERMKAYKAGS